MGMRSERRTYLVCDILPGHAEVVQIEAVVEEVVVVDGMVVVEGE